jgi:DNA-binding IscR family transcriptional regulator
MKDIRANAFTWVGMMRRCIITHCIMQQRPCGKGRACALHDAWVEGQNAILEHLGSRNLVDFSSQTPLFCR